MLKNFDSSHCFLTGPIHMSHVEILLTIEFSWILFVRFRIWSTSHEKVFAFVPEWLMCFFHYNILWRMLSVFRMSRGCDNKFLNRLWSPVRSNCPMHLPHTTNDVDIDWRFTVYRSVSIADSRIISQKVTRLKSPSSPTVLGNSFHRRLGQWSNIRTQQTTTTTPVLSVVLRHV